MKSKKKYKKELLKSLKHLEAAESASLRVMTNLMLLKEMKENIDLWLKDAKGYIDSYCAGKKVILFTGDGDEVEKVAKKFDSSEYLRVCISKH